MGVVVAASSSAVADSTADAGYFWNTTAPGTAGPSCAPGAGCPGALAFYRDSKTHKIHGLNGVSNATWSCSVGNNHASGTGSFFAINVDIPVRSNGAFSYSGPFDEAGSRGRLDVQGRFTTNRSRATGTFHVSGTHTSTDPACSAPIEASASFVATRGVTVKNHRPVANADGVPAKRWDEPVKVLANDTDADGDPLSVARVEKLKCGRLKIEPDKQAISFIVPRKGCARTQRGVYVASDGKAKSNRASLLPPRWRPELALAIRDQSRQGSLRERPGVGSRLNRTERRGNLHLHRQNSSHRCGQPRGPSTQGKIHPVRAQPRHSRGIRPNSHVP